MSRISTRMPSCGYSQTCTFMGMSMCWVISRIIEPSALVQKASALFSRKSVHVLGDLADHRTVGARPEGLGLVQSVAVVHADRVEGHLARCPVPHVQRRAHVPARGAVQIGSAHV